MPSKRFSERGRAIAALCVPAVGLAALLAFPAGLRAQTGVPAPTQVAPTPSAGTQSQPTSDLGALAALPNYATPQLTLKHWRQPEVNFYVTVSPHDTRTPAQVRALIAKGVGYWGDKMKDKLKLRMVDDPATADVEVSFVPAGSLSGGEAQKGDTSLVYTRQQQAVIVHATTKIVEGLSSDELVEIVAHECGHALGIFGHSDDKRDLMYPVVPSPAAITDRDVNTIRLAYYHVNTAHGARDVVRTQDCLTATIN